MAKKTRQKRSTSGSSHPISRRLRTVCQKHGLLNPQGKPNLSEFHRRLMEGVPLEQQYSYAATRKYLSWTEPPASYLARVAEVFGVRLEWLIASAGEITPEAAAIKARRAVILEERKRRKPVEKVIHELFVDEALAWMQQSGLDSTEWGAGLARWRLALLRLTQKLDDAVYAGAPWADEEQRLAILQAAGRWMITTDAARHRSLSEQPAGLFRSEAELDPFLVGWYDGLLDQYLATWVAGWGVRPCNDRTPPGGS